MFLKKLLGCKKITPPRVISFDGPERVGKSTQIRLLKKYLIKKGYKVKVLHSSLLAGKDVTYMKTYQAVKNFAYLAALWEATLKVQKFLEQPKTIVIFDRYILTHLAFCERFGFEGAGVLRTINERFAELCLRFFQFPLHTVCITGQYVNKADIHLDRLFHHISHNLSHCHLIENAQRSKLEIHKEIVKKLFGEDK